MCGAIYEAVWDISDILSDAVFDMFQACSRESDSFSRYMKTLIEGNRSTSHRVSRCLLSLNSEPLIFTVNITAYLSLSLRWAVSAASVPAPASTALAGCQMRTTTCSMSVRPSRSCWATRIPTRTSQRIGATTLPSTCSSGHCSSTDVTWRSSSGSTPTIT